MSIDTSADSGPANDADTRAGIRTETEQETARETAGSTRPPGVWTALRPLVLRIHFYAGLLVGPLLLIAAVSGLLYALSIPAEKFVYREELTVSAGERALPLSAQVDAARAAHPDGTVTAVWPAASDDATTRVLMSAPGVEEGKSLAVFVDPYTAEIRGELPSFGSSGALPLRTWLDELHRDLHLGESGRLYSELAASWLWIVALGGLLLWLGRRRAAKRALVLPDRSLPKGRRRTLSWHGSVGLWAVIGLVLLSATGLTWSKYAGENIGTVQDRLGGATPVLSVTVGDAPAGAGGGGDHAEHGAGHGGTHEGADIGIDRALVAARGAGIDSGMIAISLPAEGTGYVVKERDSTVPVELDAVTVDPANGKVVDELRFSDFPVLAQLTRFGIDAHMGLLLGLPNQLALAALTLGLIVLIVSGYRMWWLRRPTRGRALGGRPVPRGAWRRVPVTALLPLAAAAAFAGWFVPLLGWSLLAFLVLDLALGAVARFRARVPG
ncbi:PepSY-associated TM helix domain-containing protein [Streptomyces yaizuensis]|uniref:PepSY domain-containing protein n=1 Tax=Streptomyces yaizuensis TaxID=2989713 RepID=A0ABQ5NUI8_9ACTN|nr:PepSY domain-containing protein [Streptomyces sp. YSPA8]GLF94030.1 PepSY domain-containing protein [Streptomyces sp. YSPA8]